MNIRLREKRHRFNVRIPGIVLVAIGLVMLISCGKRDDAPPTQAQHATPAEHGKSDDLGGDSLIRLSEDEAQSSGVRVEALASRQFVDQVVLTAVIRTNQDRIAHIAPRVSARITRVDAKLGDRVKAGQVLAILDSIELGEAHSAQQQALSQYALAKSDFDRAGKLKAEDIIAEKDYLRARSEFEKAKAALRAADDKLRLLDAPHPRAGIEASSMFPVNAPFAGIVIEKDAVLGELARPDKSIFTVADLSTLWIEANLFERDLGRVRIGAPASVTVSAYPNETFAGVLTYISSMVDKESRAVQARVEVPNPDGRLKPEMFATASIETASTTKALALPQEAVLLMNGQTIVFVARDGGYETRPIEVGDRAGARLLVRSGVSEGERVVIAGAYVLKSRVLKSQIGDAH
ncbi:MAG TPA: efflux RND transporter periplasmic adaptor subunit [Burkholderiales bacterium]|nr:efflux RND transporter periplasmic adaptor subunit [Burkholderiales bacterium]